MQLFLNKQLKQAQFPLRYRRHLFWSQKLHYLVIFLNTFRKKRDNLPHYKGKEIQYLWTKVGREMKSNIFKRLIIYGILIHGRQIFQRKFDCFTP